jgi:hypothetical protein
MRSRPCQPAAARPTQPSHARTHAHKHARIGTRARAHARAHTHAHRQRPCVRAHFHVARAMVVGFMAACCRVSVARFLLHSACCPLRVVSFAQLRGATSDVARCRLQRQRFFTSAGERTLRYALLMTSATLAASTASCSAELPRRCCRGEGVRVPEMWQRGQFWRGCGRNKPSPPERGVSGHCTFASTGDARRMWRPSSSFLALLGEGCTHSGHHRFCVCGGFRHAVPHLWRAHY